MRADDDKLEKLELGGEGGGETHEISHVTKEVQSVVKEELLHRGSQLRLQQRSNIVQTNIYIYILRILRLFN